MSLPESARSKSFLKSPSGFQSAQFLIFILAIGLYFPALKGSAFWDDTLLISGGPNTPSHSLSTAFSLPFGNYFRPLTSVSFAIENSYAHGIPFFYHATNILLHGFTALLVCSLVYLLTNQKKAGVLAGLFFAAQPLQVGAVAWIGGRTDALSCFFLSGFLVCLVRSLKTPKWTWLAGSWACFFLAVLAKEQAVAMLPAVPLAVFLLGSKSKKDAWRTTWPYCVILVVYLLLWVHGGPIPKSTSNGLVFTFVVGLKSLAHYGMAFLLPNTPSLITFTLENYHSLAWAVLGLAFASALVFFLRSTWKEKPVIAWLGVCALLVYIPVSNVPTLAAYVMGPYRCALAGIGVACLFGIGLSTALSMKRTAWVAVLALNLLVGTGVSWWGVNIWRQPKPFFAAVVANDPHFLAGIEQYCKLLDRDGQYAESAKISGKALSWVMGSEDWGKAFLDSKTSIASPDVNDRLKTNTGRPEYMEVGTIMANRAFSLARCGQTDAAILSIRDAMIVQPGNPWVHLMYSKLIIRTDRALAIKELERAVQENPLYGDAVVALAKQRIIDKRYAEADQMMVKVEKDMGFNGYFWLELFDAKIGDHDYKGAAAALVQAQHAVIIPQQGEIDKRQSLLTATKN
jgi:hypothetical protein